MKASERSTLDYETTPHDRTAGVFWLLVGVIVVVGILLVLLAIVIFGVTSRLV